MSMISARPPTAPPGRPPATILAMVVEVRRDPIPCLDAARRCPEAGDHLIKNEHDGVLGGQLTKALQKDRDVEGQLAVVSPGGLQG